MKTIQEQIPTGSGVINLVVPAGPARRVTVAGSFDGSGPPAFTGVIGSATASLPPGAETNIPISMSPRERLIIPDQLNNRIVLIDRIQDGQAIGWKVIDSFYSGFYQPYSVDHDKQGRIWLVEDDFSSGYQTAIRRIDDVAGAGSDTSEVGTINETFGRAMTIDRTLGRIYYYAANYGTIEYHDIGGASGSLGGPYYSPTGLAVDETGLLYISDNDPSDNRLLKITPSGAFLADYIYGIDLLPHDVIVKGDRVYVAVEDLVGGNHRIDEFDLDLTPFASLTNAMVGGSMLGPRRFVAPRNAVFTLIDEGAAGDQLIRFLDMKGQGFTTFGSTGSGVGQFEFFQLSGQ
jgi:hypothetical protein